MVLVSKNPRPLLPTGRRSESLKPSRDRHQPAAKVGPDHPEVSYTLYNLAEIERVVREVVHGIRVEMKSLKS